jgi:hypothetical protein
MMVLLKDDIIKELRKDLKASGFKVSKLRWFTFQNIFNSVYISIIQSWTQCWI